MPVTTNVKFLFSPEITQKKWKREKSLFDEQFYM
jgi:hypothetical protein